MTYITPYEKGKTTSIEGLKKRKNIILNHLLMKTKDTNW